MNSRDPLRRNNVTVTGRLDAEHTLVFVHGFGTDQSAWRAVQTAFSQEFRVVLLDNVGAGQSDPQAFRQHRYLNLRTYVSDLLEVCDALDLGPAALVGHSVGGMICALAAVARPAMFERLMLIGASPRYLNDADYHGGFSENDLGAVYQAVTQDFDNWAGHFAVAAMANPDKPDLARDFAGSIRAIPQEQALTVLCSIFQSDHRDELANLNLPTLLIQAREDFAVPLDVARYLNQHIRSSTLRVINATGHLPHVSAPGEVVAAMREFMAA